MDKTFEEKKKEMYKRIYRDVYEKFQCDKKTLMELFQAFQQEIEPEIRSDESRKVREGIRSELVDYLDKYCNEKIRLHWESILKIVSGQPKGG